ESAKVPFRRGVADGRCSQHPAGSSVWGVRGRSLGGGAAQEGSQSQTPGAAAASAGSAPGTTRPRRNARGVEAQTLGRDDRGLRSQYQHDDQQVAGSARRLRRHPAPHRDPATAALPLHLPGERRTHRRCFRPVGGPGAGHVTSIAVLPLKNLSGEPQQDYFADGMTEALITELGKIGALQVLSYQSMVSYRQSAKPLRQIAQELKVEAILEGAVL